MKSSAVLLIDLENFYCSREEFLLKNGQAPAYDKKAFAADLERLLLYAREMVQPLPFIVRRAYANFNVYRFEKGGGRQFYLRDIPDELMKQGVEPVQVFRLSQGRGGVSKNAADMRMAMEATALLVSASHVEHFVLVTGDADFIPVVLELKRHGHAVSLIGVTNATNGLIQRFVDQFELFEDLIAAEEVETQIGHPPPATAELTEVATALRRLLGRTRPLKFAAVKPLLSKELNKPFDPLLFECDTTGEFLRKHAAQLGLEVRHGPHDWVVDLPGAAGSKVAPRPAPRPAEAAHAPDLYRKLLGGGGPAESPVGPVKVPLVPWESWAWTCDATFAALSPAAGGGPTLSPQLLARLLQSAAGTGAADRAKQVQRIYPFVRVTLGSTGADGTVTLPPAIAEPQQLRAAVLRYLVSVLAQRLKEQGGAGPVRPEAFAAAVEAGPAAEQVAAEVAVILATPQSPPGPPPEARPDLPPEEAHTAEGYAALLRAGGPKGCETEAMKVPPVPWPVVERVCDAAFAALSPTAGGSPMPWDDLHARLVEAADGGAGDPDRHVRRVLGMLRTAELTAERDDLLSLRDDIDSAEELRWRVLMFALSLLHYRLGERGIGGPIRPDRFAESLDAGHLSERIAAEVAPVIPQLGAEEARPGEEPAATAGPTPVPPPMPRAEEDEVPIATAEAFEAEPEGATPSLLSSPLMMDPAVLAEDGEPEPEPEPKPAPGPVPDDDDEIDLGAIQMPPGESPSAVIKLGTKKIVIEPILAGEWIAGTDGLPEGEPLAPEPNAPPAPAPEPRPPHPPEFA